MKVWKIWTENTPDEYSEHACVSGPSASGTEVVEKAEYDKLRAALKESCDCLERKAKLLSTHGWGPESEGAYSVVDSGRQVLKEALDG